MADLKPYLAKSFGICARVQGMNRYYALLLFGDGNVRIIKTLGRESKILYESGYKTDFGKKYDFCIEVKDGIVTASINNQIISKINDKSSPFLYGGIALFCEEGCIDVGKVRLKPVN